jgi:hypothetical protein
MFDIFIMGIIVSGATLLGCGYDGTILHGDRCRFVPYQPQVRLQSPRLFFGRCYCDKSVQSFEQTENKVHIPLTISFQLLSSLSP